MSKELLQLPLEIVYQILSLLSPFDLTACQLVNKHLHDIIRGSVTLQYIISLALAKADDNPCSLASLAEKLEDVKASEAAWSSFQPKFTVSLPVMHNTSGIYDLSGGTYLLGNADRRVLQYLMLPTKIDDSLRWDKVSVSKTIIDMGFCVFEHDLIAVITTTTRLIEPSQTEVYILEMFLLEYSTGKPHPKAKESCIFIMTSGIPRPSLACEIVGENLVLILNFLHPSQPPDRVFIWNWRQNVLKTTLIAPCRTYSGVIYLTEDLILLPNSKSNAFEVFHIPQRPVAEPLKPFLSFSLPSLANGVEITHIICRAEPNPIANISLLNKRRRAQDRAAACMSETDPFAPRRGFLASADEAICIFQLRFTGGPVTLVQGGLNVHFDMGHSYTIYIHRKTFLDLIRNHEIAHEKDFTLQKEAGSDSPSQAESLPWAQWGPLASRWFSADVMPIKWITTSAGQRCAVIHDDAGLRGSPIMIIDFNPYNVRKMTAKMRRATQAAKETEENTMVTEEVRNTTEYIEGSLDGVLREDSFADGDDTNSFFQSPTHSEAADGMDVDDDDSWFTVDDDDGNGVAIEQQTQFESNSDIIPAFVFESASEGGHTGNNPRAGFAVDHSDPGRARYRVFDVPSSVDSAGTFAEIVEGYLPCVAYISERRYNYDGVLLDEERIIGIKTDANDRISAIDIMYFG